MTHPRAATAPHADPDAPDHPVRELTCRVHALEPATHDIVVVRLTVAEGGPFAYAAGQYARVTFDGFEPRDYSIASRPSEATLAFHIRNVGGGPSAYVANSLTVGEPVRVRGPFGHTYLRAHRPEPIVLVAGGSGLGQMAALAEEALARGLSQPIQLYFGCRDEPDLYLEDRMAALMRNHPNFRFVPVLSEPQAPTARRSGLVTDALAADLSDLTGAVAYLAGPPPMVEAATRTLAARGVDPDDIHADAFIGEAARKLRDGET
jgi:CDP-4-dehydro-6-deoxyglucose reductase/ferredoxin-NAD(P)+ reductase (naphthalene dioxygenase ferredoxin-specific)